MPEVTVKAWSAGDFGFTLTEQAGRKCGRFVLSVLHDGAEVERKGFDLAADADANARHLGTPLPKPDRFEPSHEDRIWWAIEGEREESPLDRWLETACPEPVLSVSGEWMDFGDQYLGHQEGGDL